MPIPLFIVFGLFILLVVLPVLFIKEDKQLKQLEFEEHIQTTIGMRPYDLN